MNRCVRTVLTVPALALALALGGCGYWDPTDIFSSEFFNTKKKLPGERIPVFPDGTPGVPQGVPQELTRGYQPPAEPEPVLAEPAEVEAEPKAKPRPKPKVARRPAPVEEAPPPPTRVRPTNQQPPTATQWPAPPSTQQQPAAAPWPGGGSQPSGQTVWPDPPAPGTFSR